MSNNTDNNNQIRRRMNELTTDNNNITTNAHTSMDANTNNTPDHSKSTKSSSLSHDHGNILLLLMLYTLQGIPMGLSASLPLIMKERGISYQQLSYFSLVSLPFSLKLFWAPIVDSWYISWIGRRKTWLIPTQIITGFVMIMGSYYVNKWMNENESMDIMSLTLYFSSLYFLMATQDIAVDGWALTILSRENVTYASICNTIGQSLGVFVANQSYIALTDPIWCQKYLHRNEAVFNLAGFMSFWGWVFLLITILIMFFKQEKKAPLEDEPDGLWTTFQHTITVLKIPSVQILCVLLLTFKCAFAATDSVFTFRLQEIGVEKSDIATLSSFLIAVGFIVPWLLSSRLSSHPLRIMMIAYVLKLVTSFLRWLVIESIRNSPRSPSDFGMNEFGPLFIVMVLHEMVGTALFISVMSFFARISDPSIGGTYMTLLNTVTNLGSLWPRPLALWLLPIVSTNTCTGSMVDQKILSGSEPGDYCQRCVRSNGTCGGLDGFTIETFVFLAYGLLWIIASRKILVNLENKPHTDWLVSNANSAKVIEPDNSKSN